MVTMSSNEIKSQWSWSFNEEKKKPKYILCYFSSVILPLCLVKDYIAEDF